MRFLTLPLVVFFSSVLPATTTTDPNRLSIPENWRVENTAYPPPWAKSLPWKGTIELRFPPGFFKPESPYFWSYPILYTLQGDVIKTDQDLKLALRTYDVGLYGGRFPLEMIRVTFSRRKTDDPQAPIQVAMDGFDPFTTKKPLRTYLSIYRRYDEPTDKTTILILRSSRKYKPNSAVWKGLLKFRHEVGF